MGRRRWMCLPMIALALLLGGCGPVEGSAEEQLALEIRGEYLELAGFSASLELTADYGQRVYQYAMDVSWEREGETVLTLTAPETVAGVTARLRDGETALEYDGMRVETGPLDQSGLSPVDAVPALLGYIREGYIAACGMEELDGKKVLRLICRDPEKTAGEGLECSLWFDPGTHALLRGELSQDGFTVIRCGVVDFSPA